MDILVDSSIIIASEKGLLNLDDIAKRHANDSLSISAISVAELEYGVQKRPARHRTASQQFVEQLLARFPVVPFDTAAARTHAALRLLLERAGAPLGHNDLLIASIAIAHSMAVATRDRDFGRLQQLTLLNW